MRCIRCGKRAVFQWQVCADGNVWRPLCPTCDVALNRMVLQWMGDPAAEAKIKRYATARGIKSC